MSGLGDSLRIAVVSDAVLPWNTGGKERRLHELLIRLAERGHHIDVYTMKWWATDGSGPDTVTRDGLTYHAICRYRPLYAGGRRSIVQAVMFALATLTLVRRRFDVLDVDAIPFLPLVPAQLVAWVRRRPMLVTWHEYWGRAYWVEYLGVLGHVAATVERLAVRCGTVVIAASEATGERLRSVGPSSLTVHTVPSGVDVAALQRVTTDTRPMADVDLVAIGRLLDHKRIDVAIEAVALLRDRGEPAHLTVIGEGPHADDLTALVERLDLSRRVEFVPFLPEHDDVLAVLASASMLVFPTVREGFGIAALEALAVGTPVITSNHPDNLAQLLVTSGVSGQVCDSAPEAVAEAIVTVRASREAFSRGAVAAAHDHDWRRLVDEMDEIYAATTR